MKHTRKILSLLLALSLVLTLAQPALASDALGEDVDAQSISLHRGTELAEGVFWSEAYSDFRHENYIVYEPSTTVTPIVTYGTTTRERTTVAEAAATLEAQGYRVVAGINGDYYDTATGIPLGTVITDGELRTATSAYYAVGFRADGTAILGAPAISIRGESAYGSFSVASVNQVRYSYGGIFLYSNEFNSRASTGTNAAGYDIVCSVVDGRVSIGETVTLCVDEVLPEATDTVVPEGKYVLTANLLAGDKALGALGAFAVGDTFTLTVSAADEGWNDVEYAVGALYQLVEDGRVCEGLEKGAAPRTAIGQRRDGSIVFYTIDGRASGYSVGATLTQVAERLVELGCVTALSLDGGGSTTLSVTLPEETSASVYNSPSGGTARAVTNHVFLVATNEASGRLDHVSLRAESDTVLAGADVELTAVAVDKNYLPMSSSLTVRANNGGKVEQAGEHTYTLTAPERGDTVKVTASRGSERASVSIDVVTSPERIELRSGGKSISALRLAPGQSVQLEARAYEGYLQLTAQNDCFAWELTGDVGTVDENGRFTAVDQAAYGTLTVSAGKTELTVPVYVSADPYVLLDGFEETATFAANTDKNYVRYGAASARWDYTAENTGSGETLATAALSYRIPDGYERVSLWVCGDGSGAQLSLLTAVGNADDAEASETNAVALDFTGWQQLHFDVSGAQRITGIVLRSAEQGSGTLYLDQLTASRALTDDDATAPELTLTFSEDGTALTGRAFDAVDGASLATLRVSCDGKSLAYTYDHQTGALHASLPASDGSIHRVTVVAGDASGNLARASLVRLPENVSAAFPDTDGHRANVAVSYLKSVGVTTGDEKGNFNPESAISRQEFAVLLARWLGVAGEYTVTELPFADNYEIGTWALDGVRAMYALGVTKGSTVRGALCFNPRDTISRQEALTMLGRLVELGYGVREQSYTDSDAVADWAKPHLDTLASLGVLAAYEDGSVRPTQPITRAEVAELLYQLS